MHILWRRNHWNYFWKYYFFFAFYQFTTSEISKFVGAVLVPISKQRNVRGPLTQLSARGISSTAVRSPFYCLLRSRPFFLVLFPSCFLRLPSLNSLFLPRRLPPALFVCTRAARYSGSYRHSLFLRVPSIRLHLLSFPLQYWLYRLKIPRAIVIAAIISCNKLECKLIRSV